MVVTDWDGTGVPTANVRSSPSASASRVAIVTQGETYKVVQINESGGIMTAYGKTGAKWYQIVLKNGNKGWLWSSYGSLSCR